MAEKAKTNWFKKHKVLTVILVVVGLFVVIGVASGGGDTSNTTSTQNNQQGQATTPAAQPEAPKFDPEVAYPKIDNGMTKAQVEQVTGKKSEGCTESAIEGLGTTELCSYGGFSDKGSITVTYSNGKVSSKTQTMY